MKFAVRLLLPALLTFALGCTPAKGDAGMPGMPGAKGDGDGMMGVPGNPGAAPTLAQLAAAMLSVPAAASR